MMRDSRAVESAQNRRGQRRAGVIEEVACVCSVLVKTEGTMEGGKAFTKSVLQSVLEAGSGQGGTKVGQVLEICQEVV